MIKNKDEIIIPKNKKDPDIKDSYEPVGLKLVQDPNGEHFKFYFPPKYVKDKNKSLFDYKDEIFELLTIIDKLGENESFNESGSKSFLPIYSCLWIINDYLNNGTYKETEKFYSTDIIGKISWKNTIKKVMPYVIDDKLIYSKFNVERIRQKDNEFFVKIQNYCIIFAVNIVGWYFGIEPQKIEKLDENTIKFYITYLQKKLQETFLDYKKFLIRYMISILENSHESTSLFSSVFTDTFHTVFENLVVNTFSTVSKEDLKHFYPTSKWYINGYEPKEDTKLRPDAIYIDNENKKIYIIDAKYYNYGYQEKNDDISGLPSTADVSKQVRYAEDLETRLCNKQLNKDVLLKYKINNNTDEFKIYSVFVLPFSKENIEEDVAVNSNQIKYIGYNEMDKDKKSGKKYTKVYTFIIDLKTLVKAYRNEKIKNELKINLKEQLDNINK